MCKKNISKFFLSLILFLIPSLLLPHHADAANCTQPANPIVAENCKPGNPSSDWQVGTPDSVVGDNSIVGFASDMSYNKSTTVHFKVKTDATSYRIDIYRLGYYGGLGARKWATVTPSATLPQTQPACVTDDSVHLIDCGNWSDSATWAIPSNAVSGLYVAKLVRTDPDNNRTNHIFFIVRDDSSTAPVLFQTSDATWQAYNAWGGYSLYVGPNNDGSFAHKVSYNRPFDKISQVGNQPFFFEVSAIRWLEQNGYNMSYLSEVDTDRRGTDLLKHKVFLSVGHDEYWSAGQRTNVETARNNGVNLMFLTGNEVYWKTRWENSIANTSDTYRTLVTYKETFFPTKIDPLPGVWTGNWRDKRGQAPLDGFKPENGLTGTIFTAGKDPSVAPIIVPAEDGKMRFWRNTSVASLASGQSATFANGILGGEWDEDWDNGFRPAGLIHLSTTTQFLKNGYLTDTVDKTTTALADGVATHHLTLYRASSGALVFSAGANGFVMGLDNTSEQTAYVGCQCADLRLQQAMVNLFADMGVQPDSLGAGLTAATRSTDTTPPASTITFPSSGASLPQNNTITIKGTAADTGGVVGGVEISTDNGSTWHPVTGRGTWQYNWTPTTSGTVTIKTRAADDSGNIETPSAGVNVTVTTNSQSKLLIFAAGTPAGGVYPTMNVYVNNKLVKTFPNIQGRFGAKDFEVYAYTQATPIQANQVRIALANDLFISQNEDRNLYVDKIQVDGTDFPTIAASTYSTGTVLGAGSNTGCIPSTTTENVLRCNGSFFYNQTGTPNVKGIDSPGVVQGSIWQEKNSNSTGYSDAAVTFNHPGTPLSCDWDGDGIDTPGVFNNGTWTIQRSNNPADIVTIQYGDNNPAWKPLCGDWDGDGKDTPGLFANGIWYLRNTLTSGVSDVSFAYGDPGDIPFVGDWNGDGIDTPGVLKGIQWYLRNSNSSGVSDINFSYGFTGGQVVIGDWNGDGIDTPGLVSGGVWYLRNSNTSGQADITFRYGNPGDPAVKGDWDGK